MTQPKRANVVSPRVFGLIMGGALVALIFAFAKYFWIHDLLGHHGRVPYPYDLAAASAAWFGIWLLWLYYRRSQGFPDGANARAAGGQGK